MKLNKTEQLQKIVNSLRKDCQYEFQVEYRPNKGWYLVDSDGGRWWHDDGEFMGSDFKSAEEEIKRFLS